MPKNRSEKATENEPGGVGKSRAAGEREGRALRGAAGAGSPVGAGAQQAMRSQAQPWHRAGGGSETETETETRDGSPEDSQEAPGRHATTACPRKTRSRATDWRRRVTGGEKPGIADR